MKSKMLRTVFMTLLLSHSTHFALSTDINKNCYFTTKDGLVIDMQSQTTDLMTPSTVYDYHYDPCEASKEINGVKYLVWQEKNTPFAVKPLDFGLGLEPVLIENSLVDVKEYFLEFDGQGKRTTRIQLICDRTNVKEAKFSGGEDDNHSGHYEFKFSHSSACPKRLAKGLTEKWVKGEQKCFFKGLQNCHWHYGQGFDCYFLAEEVT